MYLLLKSQTRKIAAIARVVHYATATHVLVPFEKRVVRERLALFIEKNWISAFLTIRK